MKKIALLLILIVSLIALTGCQTTQVSDEPISLPNENTQQCLPEQRNAEVCIEIYQPVCATINVQCIKAPCNPVQETFSNSCEACKDSLVESYVIGEC